MDTLPNTRERRWSSHGWNNRLSLFLIRSITPRLPSAVLPAVHGLMTGICYAAMPRERRASLANLERVCGRDGTRLRRRSLALFYNFSRFMVSRLDLARLSAEDLARRVVNLDEARAALTAVLREGNGAIAATAHLGNWEIGARLLCLTGRRVHVVMMADGDDVVEHEYQRLRAVDGVQTHWVGGSDFLAVDLLSALRRGELVALQADRDTGSWRVKLPLFGAPVWLPLGPASLARASGASILPCFVLMESGNDLRLHIGEPIRVARGLDATQDLREATRRLARAIEAAVSERPDQWFNFYPIWDPEKSPA